MTSISGTQNSGPIFPQALAGDTTIPDGYYAFWANLIIGSFNLTIAATGILIVDG